MLLLLLSIIPPSQERGPPLRLPCNLTVNMGDELCDNNATTMRYHFDKETMTCLPFKYTGCGGNANNFPDSFTCTRHCIPMDYHNCPANAPPMKREDGTYGCNDRVKCPKGSTCMKGFVIGLCCDNKEYEKYLNNAKPDCGHKKIVKDTSVEYSTPLFGKTCGHQFCPEKAECHQGAFYAYCCL
ncbi:Kunitz/Bovine pancreatic trypsin inhibitor domain protein [Dictyocaulus viviparus]|uniref:Kunitz/Bovine pancreatic trypsin inhibitor domain protein n=1 Tax=Dictyocaulus viviparus TaxID=29172 RepID=A0A0D8Y0A2_DICVI|nr:Kunitz/Bovine pancreatic trypsin inhibitor domain protein [Dictyocaulus viviparus]